MPRKYLAMPNDVFSLVSVTTIYSMINPIEKKLVAAGYKGPLLADFNNDIYKTARCGRQRSHTEITGASNEEWMAGNKGPLGEAPQVDPVYKKTADSFVTKGNTFQAGGRGGVRI